MKNEFVLIAEVKTKSPFGFQSAKSWDELFELANKYGNIISVHTDPRWEGSFDLVKKAKSLTKKPILAKGIHASDEDIKQAVESGADFVLVVGRIPGIHKEKCILEPLTLGELKKIPESYKVVWNSRNLSNGGIKKESFADARKVFKGFMCQASNIKSLSDVEEEADAVLVGENLEAFIESCKRNSALVGEGN